ncbi:MAG: hypothetical protein GY803_25690 [Chloroflexi bacterium]|nr:hypothetical protein [Chloroflexota bacterium]
MIDAQSAEQPANPRRIFAFLLLYRWLSLSVPLAAWLLEPDGALLMALLVATAVNGLISLSPIQLNRALRWRGWLLAADLVLAAALIAITGGCRSSFYYYSLSPALIAAFYFGFRGAMTTVSAFMPLYAFALAVSAGFAVEPFNWLLTMTAVIGYYLISGSFGYAAGLVAHLRQMRDDLKLSHQELEILHDLTVSLQSASDVAEVQEKVLEAITTELGFRKAVIGLIDPEGLVVTGWLGRSRDGAVAKAGELIHSEQVPLTADGGLAARALLDRRSFRVADDWLNRHFEMDDGRIFPLILREHAVGVLLVDMAETSDGALAGNGRFATLEAIAGPAAVSIGATMLCINRAQQIAVQDERLRIAQDLHDAVSQSLFGIVYTLDGSLKLLPDQPEVAKPELERTLETAEQVRAQIRQTILDIWPTELTAERFTADLRKYAHGTCALENLQLEFDVRGEFGELSPQARRSLYRISQEALANIGHHAAAGEARVCVEVANGRAQLSVRDNGRGFEPQTALAREYGREHFGLRGIRERALALGGECHIFSQPGAGASVVVDIPV